VGPPSMICERATRCASRALRPCGVSEIQVRRRAASVPFGLVDDLEDLAAEELLDDLTAVARGDDRVLVVAGRSAGGVGFCRRRAAAHAGALPCVPGGLRRFTHERRAAARCRGGGLLGSGGLRGGGTDGRRGPVGGGRVGDRAGRAPGGGGTSGGRGAVDGSG